MICVDWSRGAKLPDYTKAVVNTRLVGAQIARLVERIGKTFGEEIHERCHIVGHSLGAHVAGFTGSNLKRNGKTLHRITGR